MIRQPDALGNRLLDYSGVGYKGGTVPIPSVTVKTNIAPVAGDNGANIQAAINYVATLPLDTNGFRGAVLLSAGEYPISNSITITASGIVLRGVGDGSDTNINTVLRATYVGSNHPSLVVVSGVGSPSTVGGTTHNITDTYVPVGARSFSVDSTNGLSVGAQVFVRRPSTSNWIQALGMDQLTFPWMAGSFDLYFQRAITRIEGNVVTLDEPITCALEQQYGGGTIYKYTWSSRITNVGIEYLRGISDFNPSVTTNAGASSPYFSDENHGWTCIMFSNAVANAWVRNVTDQYFGYACVSSSGNKYSGTRNITVRDCNSLDPVSIITGERRYAFVLNDSQFCLIQNCYTRNDRHQFVTMSLTTGPNVFVDGLSDTAYNDAGPHFQWGTGAMWDNITVNSNNVDVQNRGNLGTAHGWAGANEVVWNSKAKGFIVQNPPTARNWLIGSVGTIQSGTSYVGPHDDGTYDSHGTNVFPNSLYYAQLQDRLAAPNLETREYWVGDIDQFVTGSPTGDVVTVNSAWRTAVQTAAGGAMVNGFDIVTNGQWVPFTFNYSLSVTDRIVGATLAFALRSTTGTATNAVLYLDSTGSSNSFSSLGWSTIGAGTNTTVRVLDLASQLSLLADGNLNLAVAGDVGVDWAMLELQVAPVIATYTNTLYPVADTFAQGGTNSSLNFGTNTTLLIKADTSANSRRQGYLRWNLAGCSGNVLQALVRLTPTSVGTNGLEHGITLATSNQWSETTLNWDNQPGGGKRFATWIPSTNGPVEFVVTPQVQAALAGDGQLSLELFSLNAVGAPGLVSYASREDANATRRPQLLLIYSNAAVALAASFDATPTAGGAPLAVTFTDTSTGALTNRCWSFGDSVTTNTTATSVLHIYQFPGTNTVRLIVSGASGLSTNTQTNLIVAASVDTVGDSIPDWWRALYFGGSGTTTNAASCAACDLTGTGQNNLFKYVADLNPTDPASRLAIISISASNNDVHLIWIGGANAWQYLECSPSLVSNHWSANSTNPPPTAITNSVIHVGAATATNLFYRIKANR